MLQLWSFQAGNAPRFFVSCSRRLPSVTAGLASRANLRGPYWIGLRLSHRSIWILRRFNRLFDRRRHRLGRGPHVKDRRKMEGRANRFRKHELQMPTIEALLPPVFYLGYLARLSKKL